MSWTSQNLLDDVDLDLEVMREVFSQLSESYKISHGTNKKNILERIDALLDKVPNAKSPEKLEEELSLMAASELDDLKAEESG